MANLILFKILNYKGYRREPFETPENNNLGILSHYKKK